MAAEKFDLYIDQGSTFSLPLQLQNSDGSPINITSYTFSGKIRKTASSPIVLATFTFTKTSASTGEFTVSLTATETASLQVNPSNSADRTITEYAYDFEFDTGSEKQRFMNGIVYLSPEVTR